MDNICKFIKTNNLTENLSIINFVFEKECAFKHSHITSACHSLALVVAGEGVLHTLNRDYAIKEGDLFFTFSAKPYYIESINNLQYIYISFIGLRATALFNRLRIRSSEPVYHDFSFLSDRWQDDFKLSNDNNVDLICESLLLYTLSFICENPIEKVDAQAINNILLLKQYVDNNYTDPLITLTTVSMKFNYNTKYLSSAFVKLTKIPFTQYLSNLRIKHAQALMKAGITNIQKIAIDSGFSDAQYFSKIFKKYCGISPKAYLSQNSVKQ